MEQALWWMVLAVVVCGAAAVVGLAVAWCMYLHANDPQDRGEQDAPARHPGARGRL